MYKGKIINNQIILPDDLPYQVEEEMVLCKGLNGHLYLFNPDNWELFMEKFDSVPYQKNKKAQQLRSFFITGCMPVEKQAAGFTVPGSLLDFLLGRDLDEIKGSTYEVDLIVEKECCGIQIEKIVISRQ